MIHLAGIIAAIAVFSFFTFLPFFPGRYDGFAMSVSLMFHIAGILGLALVPIGLMWMISELRGGQYRRGFALAAIVVGGIIGGLAMSKRS